MKHLLITFFALFLTCTWLGATPENQPKADPGAEVVCGNARFTVLTPKLIRMEWSEDGKFEDRATLAIVNRRLDVPQFKVTKKGSKVTIVTSDVKLQYSGPEKFSEKNLSVTFSMKDTSAPKGERKVVWTPGMDDSANLLGTTRTLDGFDGRAEKVSYDKGILSRDGWAIVDESSRHLFVEDDSDWKTWVAPRDNSDRCDYYIFAYGHNYKEALGDFIKIAGRIPLPPKYTLGYWWSRYWQYSDSEFVDLAKEIKSMGIPLDVMVIDMDWHYTWTLKKNNSPKDEFGQRIGWTGYTWQKQLFPNPENFLRDIHNLNLKTSLNLHPASGIQPYEECYDRFVKDYLSRTDNYDGPKGFVYPEGGYQYQGNDSPTGKAGEKAPVPFQIDDRDWTDAYFNSVIHPIEDMGVDFWWLDWQQWKESKYMKNLSNTFWLNRTFFDDKVRRTESEGKMAERPFIYHRWGGLGSHRYQLGFSGDTHSTWSVLGYLPYFTATASNVGYGYWGHDIGGHTFSKGQKETDPEMLTRWLQYGVFTPIFKTHSTKNPAIERRIWQFPEYFKAMRETILLRYALSPYIYTAAREAYDTGVSMCRPMYYDYPESDKAYEWTGQQMFGNDILVSVIDTPADPVTGLSKRAVWLPEGSDWYDVNSGTLIKGGSEITATYTIDENPYFIKAGAVIPMTYDIDNLQTENNRLRLLVAPGGADTEAVLYEDDGCTQAYTTDYATTRITKSTDGETVRVKVDPRQGSYKGMPATREVRVVFDDILPPKSVKVNGKEIEYSRFEEVGKWLYDGLTLSCTVVVGEVSADEGLLIECTYPQDREAIDGKRGVIRRMFTLTPEAKDIFGREVDRYTMLPEAFLKASQSASYITENPSETETFLRSISPEETGKCFDSYQTLSQGFKDKIKAQSVIR